MRIIARKTLAEFGEKHPETVASMTTWELKVRAGKWQNPSEVQATFSKAKVLNGERVRFEVAGGNYRMIAAFDFTRQIAFVKWLGTHREYEDIDPLTAAMF